MSDNVLVLNAGSSSIKFGLFDIGAADPELRCKGLLDEQEKAPRIVVTDPSGKQLFEKRRSGDEMTDHGLLADIFSWLDDYRGTEQLVAAGHRIVHGGREFSGPVMLDERIITALDALTPLAPLHQPRCLAPVRAVQSLRPGLTQIACFDTAFHHGLVPPASRFAVPRSLEERGIRRYGFHGLSFEYVADRLATLAPTQTRTVVAHLGNGASLCALHHGRSVDTTMGLTPLDGLVMGTRCGTIDPGILLYLMQEERMSVDAVQHLLYEGSGLLGVSGVSADMRTLLTSREPAAREAIELFTFRVAAEAAVMANTMAGLDGLIFTGGIGEHAAEIRQQICDRLAWLGVRLDPAANAKGAARITAPGSLMDVLVVPTNEEASIARHCRRLLVAGL
ncbi:acetate kinase [Bradyrhizobium sp. UFLA03-84]|uniref:acetate/propionate family kinase n=1 Tax=Bradyrhizobium sp. UFLA03-84 TaxID=418599 RepID=UPI000BADFB2E|nr:acetate/propionate family kinase [Bradyrhizobium sp. UFLA03-84]PAY10354.1 acetate kinase [Bradyrhizobium sp. UFLA03-84]